MKYIITASALYIILPMYAFKMSKLTTIVFLFSFPIDMNVITRRAVDCIPHGHRISVSGQWR